MEMAAREARVKEVGGRLHRPPRPQGTNPPDGTTTARAPGQAPHVGHVTPAQLSASSSQLCIIRYSATQRGIGTSG